MDITFSSSNCPVCGGNCRKILGKPGINDLFSSLQDPRISQVDVVACTQCRCTYVHPMAIFSSDIISRMYSSGYFPQYTKKWDEIKNKRNPERRFTAAQKYANRPIKRFLEIGCGEGSALQLAIQKGWEVQAQDISEEFAKAAAKKHSIPVFSGELKSDSFPKEYFDFIYMDSVLEHTNDPVGFMTTISGFLANGGVIYAIVPNEHSLPNQLKDFIYHLTGSEKTSRLCPFSDSYHLAGFSPKSILFIADKVNLAIKRMSCRKSYMHIKKYENRNNSFAHSISRAALAPAYLISDALNRGINLEAILYKECS